jgi:hypothetical protein
MDRGESNAKFCLCLERTKSLCVTENTKMGTNKKINACLLIFFFRSAQKSRFW